MAEMLKLVVVVCLVVLAAVRSRLEQNVRQQAGAGGEASPRPPPADGELRVQPLERARARRSAFDDDREGNDALLRRLKVPMTDPTWVPDVGPRNNFLG